MIYAIGVEFIGTNYRGWQRQQHVTSIQQSLETAFSQVADESIQIIAAGRTDAGVHASHMIAHFASDIRRPSYNWLRGVNSLLPIDIALKFITPMPEDFHARFAAKARRYHYITLNRQHRPAILNSQVTHHYAPLDIPKMITASQQLLGQHDFSSFRAAQCQSKQPIRHILRADLFVKGSFLVLDIEADGFLHHMVRNIMGTLFAIGEDKLPTSAIGELLAQKDRRLAPPTASPNGLYFVGASYEPRYQSQFCHFAPPLWL